MAMHMEEKNRQAGQDLDRIFMQRKQREQETAHVSSSHLIILLLFIAHFIIKILLKHDFYE